MINLWMQAQMQGLENWQARAREKADRPDANAGDAFEASAADEFVSATFIVHKTIRNLTPSIMRPFMGF